MIKKTNTFSIDYESESDQQHFQGTFTCKKLSIMDISKINVRKSQLSGGFYCVKSDAGEPTGQGIDEDTESLNHMIAWLEVSLIQAPGWFKLDEISDPTLVTKIFGEVIKFENSFRGRGNGENASAGSNQSGQANGQTQSTQAVSDYAPKKVVDREVQNLLDT